MGGRRAGKGEAKLRFPLPFPFLARTHTPFNDTHGPPTPPNPWDFRRCPLGFRDCDGTPSTRLAVSSRAAGGPRSAGLAAAVACRRLATADHMRISRSPPPT